MHELYSLNRRDKRRREHWHQLIKTFESSGLNQQIFCQQHEIKQDDLQRWIFKLRPNKPQDESSPSSDFIQVDVVQAVPSAKIKSNPAIELHHRSGFYFKIMHDFDNDLIQKMMQLLTRLS